MGKKPRYENHKNNNLSRFFEANHKRSIKDRIWFASNAAIAQGSYHYSGWQHFRNDASEKSLIAREHIRGLSYYG